MMDTLGVRRWVCDGMLWGVLGIPADPRPDHFSREVGHATFAFLLYDNTLKRIASRNLRVRTRAAGPLQR